jgi:hypothetical protein
VFVALTVVLFSSHVGAVSEGPQTLRAFENSILTIVDEHETRPVGEKFSKLLINFDFNHLGPALCTANRD